LPEYRRVVFRDLKYSTHSTGTASATRQNAVAVGRLETLGGEARASGAGEERGERAVMARAW
jgi:hypothetical protein